MLSPPESPHNIAIEINKNEEDNGTETEDDNDEKESTFNDVKTGATIPSLNEGEHGTPFNGVESSCHSSVASDMKHGDNSPTRKSKITVDS